VIPTGREIVALRSSEQAETGVTHLRKKPRMTSVNAERQRRYRERQKQQGASNGPILFTSEDWQLFTQRNTLPQKAGCQPNQIGRVILKELVDNALDAGAVDVTIEGDAHHCVITDDGPGVDDIARIFAVNRPLLSSKRHQPARPC
jgi:hypothetical protein